MEVSPQGTGPIRFGVFELDPSCGELRKRGLRLKLQQQPVRVLAALLERPGEVVTREELRQKLWAADVYVDFDRSLNIAVAKLREALSDSADSPRYIETLPRYGYRFIGQVNGHAATQEIHNIVPLVAGHAQTGHRIRGAGWGIALAVFLFIGSSASLLFRRSAPPRVLNATVLSHATEVKGDHLVSDGSRAYFSQGFGALVTLSEVSTAGGDVVALSTPLENPLVFDISADGSQLLVGSHSSEAQHEFDQTLWIVPTLGGAPQRVGEVRASDAGWCPDGKQIAYTVGSELNVVNLDGTGWRRLLHLPGRAGSPRWSPDKKAIRFHVETDGAAAADLWEVSADGSNAHRLLPGWRQHSFNCCGRWTSDGKYYIFESKQNSRVDLWAIPEKAGFLRKPDRTPIQLTNGPLSMVSPFPSRDGKKIYALGEQQLGELIRYDAKLRQFVPYLGGISADSVTFSSDGQWVAYSAYPDQTLWRSRMDGSEKLQLTRPPLTASVPQFSPDGKQLAFTGTGGSKPGLQTYLVSVDGGLPEPLTKTPEHEFNPWWSPDGKIVYGNIVGPDSQVFIVDPQTHQASAIPGSKGLCCPTWSHDGSFILAFGNSPSRQMLYDVAQQKWSELWRGPANYFDLSRDDKYWYFDTEWEKDPAVYRVRISDHKLEKVVSLKGIRRTEGGSGYWFDLTPDDSPMVLRNLSSQQVYVLDVQLP